MRRAAAVDASSHKKKHRLSEVALLVNYRKSVVPIVMVHPQ